MLVRKSSEKGMVFGLQTRTVKPEKWVYLVDIFRLVDLLASSASTNFMTSQMTSEMKLHGTIKLNQSPLAQGGLIFSIFSPGPQNPLGGPACEHSCNVVLTCRPDPDI